MKRKLSLIMATGALTIGVSLLVVGCTTQSAEPSVSASASAAAAAQAQVVNKLIKAGLSDAQAGRLEEAKATFNNVLALQKDNKYGYYNLGVIASQQHDSATAQINYTAALAIDPDYFPALFNKAYILESTDKATALSLYKRATKNNPKAASSFLRASFLETALGQNDNAKIDHDKAIALDPSLAAVQPPVY